MKRILHWLGRILLAFIIMMMHVALIRIFFESFDLADPKSLGLQPLYVCMEVVVFLSWVFLLTRYRSLRERLMLLTASLAAILILWTGLTFLLS